MAVAESPGQFWDNRPLKRLKPERGLIFGEMAMAKMTKKSIRPVRFTPDNLLRLQQLAAAGLSSIEIAKSMGTPASVKNVYCRHKIKIPRKRRSASNTLSKLVAHLPASLSAGFQRKAEQLQLPAPVLASRLLETIVVSDLYEAVLDDED